MSRAVDLLITYRFMKLLVTPFDKQEAYKYGIIDKQGKVEILGTTQDLLNNAISEIKSLTFTPEVGEIYNGTVRSIMPYGAFINIGKGTDGLLHVSEIDWKRVENVEDVLKAVSYTHLTLPTKA